jgi:hypothetical protein
MKAITKEWVNDKAHELENLIDHKFMTNTGIDEAIDILERFIVSTAKELLKRINYKGD